jgi:hypothetical protein
VRHTVELLLCGTIGAYLGRVRELETLVEPEGE